MSLGKRSPGKPLEVLGHSLGQGFAGFGLERVALEIFIDGSPQQLESVEQGSLGHVVLFFRHRGFESLDGRGMAQFSKPLRGHRPGLGLAVAQSRNDATLLVWKAAEALLGGRTIGFG